MGDDNTRKIPGEITLQSDIVTELAVVQDHSLQILGRKKFPGDKSLHRKGGKLFVYELGTNPGCIGMRYFPPDLSVSIERHDVLTVGTPALEVQRRVAVEDTVLLFGPFLDEDTLKGAKAAEAVSAASC